MGFYVERSWGVPSARRGRDRGGLRYRASVYRAFVPDPICGLAVALSGEVVRAVGQAERALVALDRELGLPVRLLARVEALASARLDGEAVSHRALVAEPAVEGLAVRTAQTWLGDGATSPLDAAYIPPPPERLPELIADLTAFVNRQDLPPLVQAAIALAQVEALQPYDAGNGRAARALAQTLMRERDLARPVVLLSAALVGDPETHRIGLSGFRDGAVGSWCQTFAALTVEAVRRTEALVGEVRRLQADWRERTGGPRADSSVAALIALLPDFPILGVASAQALTGRSKQATNEAMAVLEASGVLTPIGTARRNRTWEARELFARVEALERRWVAGGRSSDR